MARMYSRKRGKSGSKKPSQRIAPWVKYRPEEIEEIIIRLGKKGHGSSKIGLILRDQYGIPSTKTVIKNKITKIMKANNLYPEFPEEMMNLIKKAVDLRAHLNKNKRDPISKRGLELVESKIRRFAKYYKRKGLIPAEWKYDPEKVKLMVK